MSLGLFSNQVNQRPNKKAIVFAGKSITYAGLHHRILSAARSLSLLGVAPGHKIVVSLHNSIDYLVLHYALARLGAVIVPFSTGYSYEEISGFCAECKPNAYLIEPELRDLYQCISDEISKGMILYDGDNGEFQRILDLNSDNGVVLSDEDFGDLPTIIHYNTPNAPGTGERFNGSVQTQNSHTHRIQNWISSAEMRPEDRTLCMHPLTYAFGSDTISLPALSSGQTLYLMDCRGITSSRVLDLLTTHQITIFGSLPWLYKALLEIEGASTKTLSSLRLAMSGGAPLTVEVAEEFYERFQVRLSNAYGMTEVSVALFNFFEQGTEDLLSVGKPIHGVDVKLKGCEVSGGDVGELWIRSKGFAIGYFAQDQTLYNDSGWLQTGDLVKREDDGSYLMLGRVSQVFEVAGNRVLPAEVETVFARHPDVDEVAVVPAEVEGETQLAAFLVAKKLLTEEQIKQFFLFQGAAHLYPKYLIFRDQLPKSATGKISKAKLYINDHEFSRGSGAMASRELLGRLAKGWTSRSQVRKGEAHEESIFNIDRPDFLFRNIPFSDHSTFKDLATSTKYKLLTSAWLIYCARTIYIENKIVTPLCIDITEGKFQGLDDHLSKQLACETMIDESYHVLLVTNACNITQAARGISVEIPESLLVKRMHGYAEQFEEAWKKDLICFITSCVSEIFISDYLKMISHSRSVQPLHRKVVDAHRKDELVHGLVFKEFSKKLYDILNDEQRMFFETHFSRPIRWFAEADIPAWESVLKQLKIPNVELLIRCWKAESSKRISIDYSGVIQLAKDLGFDSKPHFISGLKEDKLDPLAA